MSDKKKEVKKETDHNSVAKASDPSRKTKGRKSSGNKSAKEARASKSDKQPKTVKGRKKGADGAAALLKPVKLYSPEGFPFHNRELSWIDFNTRVLEEAFEKDNPVLERVKFLAITASNLDEFFMVRVAGVMDRMHSKPGTADESGMTPMQQFDILSEKIHEFAKKQYSCLHHSIIPALKKDKLKFLKMKELSKAQKAQVDTYFDKFVFPVLTPLAVDTSRPFPLLANKSLNIAVRLLKDNEDIFAIVQVPSILPRFSV